MKPVTLGFVALGLFLSSGCGQSADSGNRTRPDWAVGQGEGREKNSRDRLARNPRDSRENSTRDGRYEDSTDRERETRNSDGRWANSSDSERSASRDKWRARRDERDLDRPVPPDDEVIAREEAAERRRRERDRETEIEADRYYTRQASRIETEPTSTAPATENRIASDEEESEDEE